MYLNTTLASDNTFIDYMTKITLGLSFIPLFVKMLFVVQFVNGVIITKLILLRHSSVQKHDLNQ
mgnify:CR=1 FL=1